MATENYPGDCPAIDVLDKGYVALRNVSGPTRRVSRGAVDELIVDGALVLQYLADDHLNYDASDIDPAQAARMSFQQMDSERSYEQDMKLNRYLLANEHGTPFEMIQVWLEWKVPIFIDRQFVRHGTIRRNEESARYSVLPADWYIPDVVGAKATDKKQGQADGLDFNVRFMFQAELQYQCEQAYKAYQKFLAAGVAPEHARMFLHVNHYVHYVTTVNLRNLFNFMRLRVHSHAQIEARRYGNAVVTLLREPLPGLMQLFDELVRKPE